MVKTTQINIKISQEEKTTLERGASLNAENLSSFLRRAGLSKAKKITEENS